MIDYSIDAVRILELLAVGIFTAGVAYATMRANIQKVHEDLQLYRVETAKWRDDLTSRIDELFKILIK